MFSHGVIALPHRIDSTFLKYFLQSCLCLGRKELKIFAFEVVSAASRQSFNKILNNTEAVLLTSGLWQSALGRKKTGLRFSQRMFSEVLCTYLVHLMDMIE